MQYPSSDVTYYYDTVSYTNNYTSEMGIVRVGRFIR